MNREIRAYSLIELMVTMSIIAILVAIAVPQYKAYRQVAFDTRAREDLRNVALAEETYFMQYEHYLSCANDECHDLPGIYRLSEGVELSIEAAEDSFTGQSRHPQGTTAAFIWDSERGGFQ